MSMDYSNFKNMTSYEFLCWLEETFPVRIPERITSKNDMDVAANELLKLSSEYAYMSTLSSWFKMATREAKRYESKEEYENMVDKRDACEAKLKSIEQSYKGISRAVTIRMENNAELRMTGAGTRHIA